MKLSVKGLTLASALTWGLAVWFVAIINLRWPSYGTVFLQLMSSVYPGYHPVATLGNVIVGTLYAVVDGALSGAIFGWVYNAAVQ